MGEKNDFDNMVQNVKFDHIKEMLCCMDGFSCSDKRMAKIINSHGGLDKYFEEIKVRYIKFLEEKRRIK